MLPIIGGAPRPWLTKNQAKDFGFLQKHVFYRSLRGGRVNLGPFQEKLGRLTDDQIAGYIKSVPTDWFDGGNFPGAIIDYLREARAQRETLVKFVKHLLL